MSAILQAGADGGAVTEGTAMAVFGVVGHLVGMLVLALVHNVLVWGAVLALMLAVYGVVLGFRRAVLGLDRPADE